VAFKLPNEAIGSATRFKASIDPCQDVLGLPTSGTAPQTEAATPRAPERSLR
jgi:hypothetical protein